MKYDLIDFANFVWIQLFVILYKYLIKNWLSSWFAVDLLVDPLLCCKSSKYSWRAWVFARSLVITFS